MQWWFKKFCKKDEILEDQEHSGWPSEVDNNWEQSSKLTLLQLCEKLLENSTSTILWLFSIWNKLKRWKSSISGCLVSWPKVKKKKKMSFGSVIFSYSVQQGTITWSDCDVWWKVDFIWQLTMTSSVVGLSSSKALPRAKLESTNERSWPLLGSLLPVWSTTVGFNSESQGNHYIWEVCSANQWDAPKTATPAAGTGQQKVPSSSPQQCPTTGHTTDASKVERIGL